MNSLDRAFSQISFNHAELVSEFESKIDMVLAVNNQTAVINNRAAKTVADIADNNKVLGEKVEMIAAGRASRQHQ